MENDAGTPGNKEGDISYLKRDIQISTQRIFSVPFSQNIKQRIKFCFKKNQLQS